MLIVSNNVKLKPHLDITHMIINSKREITRQWMDFDWYPKEDDDIESQRFKCGMTKIPEQVTEKTYVHEKNRRRTGNQE